MLAPTGFLSLLTGAARKSFGLVDDRFRCGLTLWASEVFAIGGQDFIGEFGIGVGDRPGDDLRADHLAEYRDRLFARPDGVELRACLVRGTEEQIGDRGEIAAQAPLVFGLGFDAVPRGVGGQGSGRAAVLRVVAVVGGQVAVDDGMQACPGRARVGVDDARNLAEGVGEALMKHLQGEV